MKLSEIQLKLHAPKSQNNTFGGYKYRNAEDILEAVKPLLNGKATVTLTDDLVMVGDRYYVKATAIFKGDEEVSVTAFARESEVKKGMDSAQITGAASSYARKYALNGLLAIDDTKDADTQDNTKSEPETATGEQIRELEDLIVEKGTDKPALLSYYLVNNLNEMTTLQATKAIGQLRKK